MLETNNRIAVLPGHQSIGALQARCYVTTWEVKFQAADLKAPTIGTFVQFFIYLGTH